jgi:hypothetical protein
MLAESCIAPVIAVRVVVVQKRLWFESIPYNFEHFSAGGMIACDESLRTIKIRGIGHA